FERKFGVRGFGRGDRRAIRLSFQTRLDGRTTDALSDGGVFDVVILLFASFGDALFLRFVFRLGFVALRFLLALFALRGGAELLLFTFRDRSQFVLDARRDRLVRLGLVLLVGIAVFDGEQFLD